MSARAPILDFDPATSTPVVRGTLDGGLETVRVAVPADVRIVSGRLEWIPVGKDGHWWPDGGSATRALDAFVSLATAQREEQFADFVRTYGVLGLMESGLPACGSRHSLDGPPQLAEPWQGCAVSWEPIAAYRHYAASVKAMLCLATALRETPRTTIVTPEKLFSEAGIATDAIGSWDRVRQICQVWQEMSGRTWEEWAETEIGHAAVMSLIAIDPAHAVENFTYSTDLYGPLENPAEYADLQRQKFGYWLTERWLKRAGLVPTITWNEEYPQLGLSVGRRREDQFEHWPVNSLFRILAAHLAARVCSGTNMATCSHCGNAYFPLRRPRFDQPHYCEGCQATAPSRRTQRSRVRRRTAQSNLRGP
jgi:hypothetical protein